MASAAYNAWVQLVHSQGGYVTNAPYSGKVAAKFPYTVFGPLVNSHQWPMPDEWSKDGTYGYYYATTALQAEAGSFSVATDAEAKAAAGSVMNSWGIPTMFQGLDNFFGSLNKEAVMIGGIALGVLILMKTPGPRRWE